MPKWVNERQTKKERRMKYASLRNAGYDPAIARQLRDWTASHIMIYIRNNPP